MAKFLTQDWLDLHTKLGAKLPARPGVSARLQYKVTGGPDGDVVFHTVIEDGKIIESAVGEQPDPDLAHTVVYADFVKTATGELDVTAAFMQGRLKLVGSSGTLLGLMPVLQSPEYKALSAKVDADTDY